MILCKVAKGEVLQTKENMDQLQGEAPLGYHSVHGLAAADGALNFDELGPKARTRSELLPSLLSRCYW